MGVDTASGALSGKINGAMALGSLRFEDAGKSIAPPVLAITSRLDIGQPESAEMAAWAR
jgi:hypothetical protein